MQTAPFQPQPAGAPVNPDVQRNLVALTLARIAELDRLREAGLAQAERLAVVAEGLSPLEEYKRMAGPKGTIQAFDRVAKAVRQVVVLEFELRGLFKAPDRDDDFIPRLGKENLLGDLHDYKDYDGLFDFARARSSLLDLNDLRVRLDYDEGPLSALIADIRGVLGVETPAEDPFAAVPENEAYLDALITGLRDRVARAGGPGAKPRPAAMQVRPAVKPAVPALPRKGFRSPPTSPHNPNTPGGKGKQRHNRGPPR
jgi:hypothetical protein